MISYKLDAVFCGVFSFDLAKRGDDLNGVLSLIIADATAGVMP